MRLLQLHSDFVEYQPIAKEIEEAEANISSNKVRLEDLVVTLVAIENGDDETFARAAINEIGNYLAAVKAKRLLIYPYAHLTSDLSFGRARSQSYHVDRGVCEGAMVGRS